MSEDEIRDRLLAKPGHKLGWLAKHGHKLAQSTVHAKPQSHSHSEATARITTNKTRRPLTDAQAIVARYCVSCDLYPCLATKRCTHNDLVMLAATTCPHNRWAHKPRVAIITPSLKLGGAERCMVDLARWLDRDKLDVLGLGILTGRCDLQLLHKAASQGPVYVGRAACSLMLRQADVMVCWALSELPVDSPPCTVFVSHSGHPRTESVESFARAGIHIAAVSEWAASTFPPGVKYTVLHNGVETERLKPRLGREAMRAQLGLQPGEVSLGFVGRASHDKGILAVPRAARALGTWHRSVIVGMCSASMRTEISAIDPRAVFVEPVEHLGDIYASLDCFMLASKSEAFSLSLIEAWLTGVPVVATLVGAIPELEAVHGTLVWPVEFDDSPDDLACCVYDAVRPHNSEVMVARAKALAEREFTAKAMGRRWTDYLLSLMAAEVPA